MGDVTKKSFGELIDALITADIKCFMAQEKIDDPDERIALSSARMAQQMNKRRSELMRAIDERMGDSGAITPKTY